MLIVLDSVLRRARIQHRCSFFGCIIKPGEEYEVSSIVQDGSVHRWKSCKPCLWLCDELERRWPREVNGYREGSYACNANGILGLLDFICQVEVNPKTGGKVRWIHPSTPCPECNGRRYLPQRDSEGRYRSVRCEMCNADGRRYWDRCVICLEYTERLKPAICEECQVYAAMGEKIAHAPQEQ